MCAHCDYIESIVQATVDSLRERMPGMVETIRLTQPEFYQTCIRQANGAEIVQWFTNATLRQFTVELFKNVVNGTQMTSEKTITVLMKMLSECRPVDHTYKTIELSAQLLDHTGSVEFMTPKGEKPH